MNLVEEIIKIKEEKNAIILAHNYQLPEVQDIADFLGDSLELARKAVNVDADVIVFAGVDFMAETAKILNPTKKVLLPTKRATCAMANMLKVEHILEAKKRYPDAPVVLYVNTTAETKAYADVTVTSANATKIVEKLDADTVIFGPDNNLAYYVAKRTGKRIIPIPEGGHCYVHRKFTLEDVERAREEHPEAKLMVHPECSPEVQARADLIVSTGGMVRNACQHDEWVVFTEKEMCYRLQKLYPDKKFYPASEDAFCIGMKSITLKHIYESLRDEKYEIEVPKEIAEKARRAIERMLEMSG
ncbi:MAG: quinolinate synthase [Thermococcaceae archaeon]|uniref:quinolinate synthase NadA n=1 Tax=Thermococcus TaxID=2263 RepID=UPI0005B27EFD|nr:MULTISPECIES: quinolinate synthase NadA [Thermococcus]KUK00131.1 MAG: Quinolinate synthase A [Thermococcales archaeon 44_46]MDK2853319.1 quinolinate synthase [Thermococcaceae archaeon]MCA6213466.1 quinolinate synthase NadA [Thermococcus bergensis]MDK2982727.1 quinolinate synthase [Thermococcaceae archaeon]MDN5319750.1 quinolinate synthase [Thermococcaceae archaeon]